MEDREGNSAKRRRYTILVVVPYPSLSLAAAFFHETIKRRFEAPQKIRILIRNYDRFFSEVNTSFLRDILVFKPDVIGFSSFFWNFDDNLKLSSIARSLLPGVLNVFGGPQTGMISDASRLMSEHPFVDAILCGEADQTFADLAYLQYSCQNYSEIPGIVTRKGDTIVSGRPEFQVRDLSQLPIIYHPGNEYVMAHLGSRWVTPFQTLRGCRNKCSYCLYCMNTLRFFPMKRLEDEISFLCSNRTPHVRVCDSHFGGTKARAMELFDIIRFHNRETEFSIYPDPDHIDEQYIMKAEQANCRMISLGVETLDMDVSARIKRKTDSYQTGNLLKMLNQHGLSPQVDLIFGLPEQTIDSFLSDISFLTDHGVNNILFSPLMRFPGTELANNTDHASTTVNNTPQNYSFANSMGIEGYTRSLLSIEAHRFLIIFRSAMAYLAKTVSSDTGGPGMDLIRRTSTLNPEQLSIFLELIDAISASSVFVRKSIDPLINNMMRYLALCFDTDLSLFHDLEEIIRFDILRHAMRTRSIELMRSHRRPPWSARIFSMDDLPGKNWAISDEAWLEVFNISERSLSFLSTCSEECGQACCIFFCPEEKVIFSDEEEFSFLQNVQLSNTHRITEKSKEIALKWIKNGVLIPIAETS